MKEKYALVASEIAGRKGKVVKLDCFTSADTARQHARAIDAAWCVVSRADDGEVVYEGRPDLVVVGKAHDDDLDVCVKIPRLKVFGRRGTWDVVECRVEGGRYVEYLLTASFSSKDGAFRKAEEIVRAGR